MDYIRNSKNRKLKTKVLNFFTRMSFSSYRLDIAGKSIMIFNLLLLASTFFPWIQMKFRTGDVVNYYAFSLYTGLIGYGILIGCLGIAFFLFSHEKKERIRAYVPFRLSDAQAIVFIDALILFACIELIFVSMSYTKIALSVVNPGSGFILALTSTSLILISSFFYSQHEKQASVTLNYLDKKDPEYLGEYGDILGKHGHPRQSSSREKNMTLPF